MSGWFAMKRGITKHHVFKGHPERMAIWMWLLDNAAWKDCQHDIGGQSVTVPRGSVSASERRISQEVGVGRQVVRTFINRLLAEKMIEQKLTHGRTMITLCNWDKYQVSQPKPNPELTHDQPIKEQGNNIPVGTADKSASAEVVDFANPNAMVWAIGKAYLTPFVGNKCGSIIGRWLKTDEPEAILGAIAAAKKSGTQDPVPYVTQALKPKHIRERDEVKRVQNAWLM